MPLEYRLRAASERWHKLSMLLTAVERGMEACSRLDAYSFPQDAQQHYNATKDFTKRLSRLETKIAREMNRLTTERLTADLVRKQQKRNAA